MSYDPNNPTEVTGEDLYYRIVAEGIGNAIQYYYGREISCEDDREAEKLWKNAYDALDALEKYLEDNHGREKE